MDENPVLPTKKLGLSALDNFLKRKLFYIHGLNRFE
jgi:hypothetical protein